MAENEEQKDATPQENRAIEQQAMNPVVTDQDGKVVAGEEDGPKNVGQEAKDQTGTNPKEK